MLRDVIQHGYLSFVADLILLVFILFNSTFSREKRQKFILGSVMAMLMLVCNAVTYHLEGTGRHLLLLKIGTAVSYSISGPVIMPFIFIASVIRKRMRVILISCATVNTLLCFASVLNGWVFFFDEQGNMFLGTFSPIPFFCSAVYLFVLLASSYRKYRLGFRRESYFISLLGVCIIIAVVMNTFYDYQYLVSGMAVLGCIFYYLFFTTQTLTRDALTNALNRHSFYKDTESMSNHQMYVISMDLNGLKQLNDTLGHDAGDAAILAVADAAHALLPSKWRFYRMGGDEFEVLCPDASGEAVRAFTDRLKANVAAQSYSVAVGFEEYLRGMDFEEVFRKADAMMYEDKAEMKKHLTKEEKLNA